MSADGGRPGEGGRTLAVILLLEDAEDAEGLRRFLGDACLDQGRATFLSPPVRGLRFFADEASQPELDDWWSRAVPSEAQPVYLLQHEEGLPEWVAGIDGILYVGVAEECAAGLYAGRPDVRVVVAPRASALALAVMRDGEELFDAEAVRRLTLLDGGWTSPPSPSPSPSPPPPYPPTPSPSPPPPAPDPFELLMRLGAPEEPADDALPAPWPEAAPSARPAPEAGARPAAEAHRRPAPEARPRPAPEAGWSSAPEAAQRWHLPLGRGRRAGPGTSLQDLAAAAVGRGPTIVVIGSRKGGVGKTSHAAGIAIAAGAALDLVGHRAAIVDANIANPDAWGSLNLPPGSATVRDVVAALAVGADPPPPVHAASPALACLPETREATEYSRTDISRLAGHLRRRYTLVIVDMSNRLPDPLAGPEAAAAAFWLEHGDVLVLPTASSKQDFNGVLDYLEVRGRPPTVVAHLVPNVRRNREHPVARQYLDAISQRVERVVPIPDEAETVRYAGMEGVPVHEVSSNLGAAYRQLLEAVISVPPRACG